LAVFLRTKGRKKNGEASGWDAGKPISSCLQGIPCEDPEEPERGRGIHHKEVKENRSKTNVQSLKRVFVAEGRARRPRGIIQDVK